MKALILFFTLVMVALAIMMIVLLFSFWELYRRLDKISKNLERPNKQSRFLSMDEVDKRLEEIVKEGEEDNESEVS